MTPTQTPTKSQPSKGPWIADNVESDPFNFYIYAEGDDCVVVNLDRREDASPKYAERAEADAALIADAGTTYHETGLSPSELAAKLQEAKFAIETLLIHSPIDPTPESSWAAATKNARTLLSTIKGARS